MRIWAFPYFYPFDRPGQTGIGIFAHRQFQGLINAGAELQVVVPVSWYPPKPFHLLNNGWKTLAEEPYPRQTTYEGITVHYPFISNKKPSRFFNLPYGQRYTNAVLEFFKGVDVKLDPKTDLVYSQWLLASGLVQKAAHTIGLKSAVLAIGDDVLCQPGTGPFPMEDFRKLWTEADCRLAVAKYVADDANRQLSVNLPYHVAYRGVNYTKFKPCSSAEKVEYRAKFGLPQDKILVLITGRPVHSKGWLELLNALQELIKTHPNVMVVGVHHGTSNIDLDDEATKRGVSEHFINVGEVAPQDMPKMYNSADIFCLPSYLEGISNAVVEGLSTGLPVITTNICGHPELIRNQETGILINPKDSVSLQHELNDLLNNEGKRAQLGAAARKFIVDEWGSFDTNASKLYSVLEACLQGK